MRPERIAVSEWMLRSMRLTTAFVSILLFTGIASANILTFSGQDNGALPGGPFPNSGAAQTAFETAASAYGYLNTITFEGLPVGDPTSPLSVAPGVTVSLTGVHGGDGFTGISDRNINSHFAFNTTPGGSEWLGFIFGSATFTFGSPTNSFGFYATDIKSSTGSTFNVTFNDGANETLYPPINSNDGAEYFGFVDSTAFTSVTLADSSGDADGIDDVTYNAVPAQTPEPASMVMVGTGMLGFAGAFRRKLKR